MQHMVLLWGVGGVVVGVVVVVMVISTGLWCQDISDL